MPVHAAQQIAVPGLWTEHGSRSCAAVKHTDPLCCDLQQDGNLTIQECLHRIDGLVADTVL